MSRKEGMAITGNKETGFRGNEAAAWEIGESEGEMRREELGGSDERGRSESEEGNLREVMGSKERGTEGSYAGTVSEVVRDVRRN